MQCSFGHNLYHIFVTEFASHESYQADIERNDEQRQAESKDVSSQDNSDEDDEAALREQLLKSLAVKRKAKLNVGVTTVVALIVLTKLSPGLLKIKIDIWE